MVKGVTRRVVVVKEPDSRVFEEVIFIVKEDAVAGGVSRRDVLAEARQVTENYFRGSRKKPVFRLSAALFAAGGAAVTGFFWLLTTILH